MLNAAAFQDVALTCTLAVHQTSAPWGERCIQELKLEGGKRLTGPSR